MLVEVLLLLAAVIAYYVYKDRKAASMPPGPWEFPFLGQMPQFSTRFFVETRKKYGDIVTTRTGAVRTVILFDYKTAKEVLSRPELSDRPTVFQDFMIDDQKSGGVVFSSGAQWVHDRRFMIRNLRNLGMGKTYLETAISFEAQALVDDLKKHNGKPIDIPNSFRTAPLNVIWQMMASRRYDLDSTEVEAIYKASRELTENGGMFFMLKAWFPFLESLPLPRTIKNWLLKPELLQGFTNSIWKVVNEAVEEHEKNFDSDNPRDLIDEYLLGMKEAQKKGGENFFRKGALCQIVADGFDAGSDTVHFSMRWVVYLLARFPDVAVQMQEQLDDAIPRDQQIAYADKAKLSLVESFVTEMFRFSSFVTNTFERQIQQDTTINGYTIPKGTLVLGNIHGMHYDSKLFHEPYEFRADRFLDGEGKFHSPKEGFFAFSGGRRMCPGENLARVEVFQFTAAILQNFVISPPDGAVLSEEVEELPFGLRMPKQKIFIYKHRS